MSIDEQIFDNQSPDVMKTAESRELAEYEKKRNEILEKCRNDRNEHGEECADTLSKAFTNSADIQSYLSNILNEKFPDEDTNKSAYEVIGMDQVKIQKETALKDIEGNVILPYTTFRDHISTYYPNVPKVVTDQVLEDFDNSVNDFLLGFNPGGSPEQFSNNLLKFVDVINEHSYKEENLKVMNEMLGDIQELTGLEGDALNYLVSNFVENAENPNEIMLILKGYLANRAEDPAYLKEYTKSEQDVKNIELEIVQAICYGNEFEASMKATALDATLKFLRFDSTGMTDFIETHVVNTEAAVSQEGLSQMVTAPMTREYVLDRWKERSQEDVDYFNLPMEDVEDDFVQFLILSEENIDAPEFFEQKASLLNDYGARRQNLLEERASIMQEIKENKEVNNIHLNWRIQQNDYQLLAIDVFKETGLVAMRELTAAGTPHDEILNVLGEIMSYENSEGLRNCGEVNGFSMSPSIMELENAEIALDYAGIDYANAAMLEDAVNNQGFLENQPTVTRLEGSRTVTVENFNENYQKKYTNEISGFANLKLNLDEKIQRHMDQFSQYFQNGKLSIESLSPEEQDEARYFLEQFSQLLDSNSKVNARLRSSSKKYADLANENFPNSSIYFRTNANVIHFTEGATIYPDGIPLDEAITGWENEDQENKILIDNVDVYLNSGVDDVNSLQSELESFKGESEQRLKQYELDVADMRQIMSKYPSGQNIGAEDLAKLNQYLLNFSSFVDFHEDYKKKVNFGEFASEQIGFEFAMDVNLDWVETLLDDGEQHLYELNAYLGENKTISLELPGQSEHIPPYYSEIIEEKLEPVYGSIGEHLSNYKKGMEDIFGIYNELAEQSQLAANYDRIAPDRDEIYGRAVGKINDVADNLEDARVDLKAKRSDLLTYLGQASELESQYPGITKALRRMVGNIVESIDKLLKDGPLSEESIQDLRFQATAMERDREEYDEKVLTDILVKGVTVLAVTAVSVATAGGATIVLGPATSTLAAIGNTVVISAASATTATLTEIMLGEVTHELGYTEDQKLTLGDVGEKWAWNFGSNLFFEGLSYAGSKAATAAINSSSYKTMNVAIQNNSGRVQTLVEEGVSGVARNVTGVARKNLQKQSKQMGKTAAENELTDAVKSEVDEREDFALKNELVMAEYAKFKSLNG